MFTGIVEAIGRIGRIESHGVDRRFAIVAPAISDRGIAVGDSVAVQGCCLTAAALTQDGFEADVSSESLELTTLGGLAEGDRVNLETSLTLHTPLGGHLVSGHIDGVGVVVDRWPDGRSERWRFRAPQGLARYIATKGSIAVDGISLTVNGVDGCEFDVNIVPHTSEVTTLGQYGAADRVNIEVDLLARYVERLLSAGGGPSEGVTRELLNRAGFTDGEG
jgi:riboflavin synthase